LYSALCDIKKYQDVFALVVCFICVVKAQDSKLFSKIYAGDVSLDEIRDFLCFEKLPLEASDIDNAAYQLLWFFVLQSDELSDQEKSEMDMLDEAMKRQIRLQRDRANLIRNLMDPLVHLTSNPR
jgi:hypothetical protein